ncbi:MAG TPA: signal peptidase I [Terriglobales bacterium]
MSTDVSAAETVVPQEAAVEAVRPRVTWAMSLQSLLGTIVVAVFVITFAVQAFQIPSASMENTLLVGDYLLVDKVHFGESGFLPALLPYDRIRHDDIIVFRFPVHPEQHFVKRVVGIPGDRVKLVNGSVFVNGERVNEPYVIRKSGYTDHYRDDFPASHYLNGNVEPRWYVEMRKLTDDRGELIVPENNYFVMGDNRDDSLDSRYWGFVPRGNIIGRPLMIYFSVAQPNQDGPEITQDGKLLSLAYAVEHLGTTVRWKRCFRMVH